MDESNVSKLLQQCKSSDVDVKIDSVTKLQAEFENGTAIPDVDAVIQTFKACLRISHQHLQAATLSALPPLLPPLLSSLSSRAVHASNAASTSSAGSSSIDSYALRQALMAFLPAGGIIDRLGDSRERSREKARESLVILGGHAFRAGGGSTLTASKSGKTQDTPLQIFERSLKEGGLTSKVWRVREQSVLTLVDIRRAHHLFPIRPYLTILVGALEDSDSTVRETTKNSVVTLFTGPGVSDAARADLKRELTKKGVRKAIVDSVFAKILSSEASTPIGEENGRPQAAAKEYIPPSLALQAMKSTGSRDAAASGPTMVSRSTSRGDVRETSRPASRTAMVTPPPAGGDTAANVQAVYIASSRDLENEFAEMLKPFEGKETEHNWAPRDRAITRVRGMLKGDVHIRYGETFMAHLKPFIDTSLKTLASLRTIVATNTCSLYNELAVALNTALDPYVDTLLSNLLRMAGFTKKIIAQTTQSTVQLIITSTSPQPRTIVPLFWTGLQDKMPLARSAVAEHIGTYLGVHGARAKAAVEAAGQSDTLERCIKKALVDSNASVRQNARLVFWSFENLWKERGRTILESQEGTNRKQLEKACPDRRGLPELPPVTPAVKKSSVAAAIAASRAKAKAIATAPPTLRHQATSAARTMSPPKRSLSPSLSTGSVSGRTASGSPPPPSRSRILTNPGPGRPVSGRRTPSASHSRNSSGESSNSVPHSGERAVPAPFTSPPRGNVLRRAMQTALPSSPPPLGADPPSPISRRPSERERQPIPFARQSVYMPDFDDSELGTSDLLTAVAIPLPDEADSDMEVDDSNVISFSSPYEIYPPERVAKSRTDSRSPTSNGHRPTLNPSQSEGSSVGVAQPVVEDALRARAEQAQSAAERLLELVEPEDEPTPPPTSLLLNNGSAQAEKSQPPLPTVLVRAPSTPISKNAAIWKQAAAFRDSPAQVSPAPSLMTDVLKPALRADSVWWRKRVTLFNQRNPLLASSAADAAAELQGYIVALDQGTADASTLKSLATFCVAHPSVDAISPLSSSLSMPASPSPFLSSSTLLPSLKPDLWTENKSFSRLFNALHKFLSPDKDEELLEYGLIVLWEMLEYLTLPMEGREAEVFTILFTIRYSNKQRVLEATTTIRDALTSRVEAVYGLTTLHAALVAFRTSAAGSYAFGLLALAKFVLRLPAEVLEDELPRLKTTLIAALTDAASLVVREAAAAAIIAAQVVLRDDAHLFALLDGLADDKKNLLTYLFDKHGVRGGADGAGAGAGSVDRLEREMRRLDGRTSTPPRGSVLSSA
ncbi:clasp N terminal-domain-containing protein [Gloeopeniophorella convolvens]|nr:clasp N terminal-domain-containing protein [Gloeopeniophorella convolvens]